MPDFHATLVPNIASSGDTLTLTFDLPQTASDVIVEIQEVDLGNEDEPKGPPSLVGRFFGKIEDGSFVLVPRKKGDNPEKNTNAGKNAPQIKVSVGGTEFPLDLPGKDNENGVFELQLKVSGKGKKPFTSDTIVFVRDFNHFVSNGEKRPVITFITDVDTPDNPFFSAATTFWRKNADAVFVRPGISLAGIWDFLNKQHNKFGDWGEINIVSHGNILHALIRLFAEDAKLLTDHLMKETFGENPNNRDLSKFGALGIDDKTRVVFRSCEAGNHAELLDDIQSNVMGGSGTLFIPKFIQGYDGNSEFFQEMLFFFVPGDRSPAAGEVETKIKAQFVAKHPTLDFDKEKSTFANHDRVINAHFKRSQILEVEFFKDKSTGESMTGTDSDWKDKDVVAKDNADLIKDMEQIYTDKGLEQDDLFWLVPASEWRITPLAKKLIKSDPTTFWLTLSGSKVTAKPMFRPMTGDLTVGGADSNDWVVKGKGVADEHFTMSNNSGTMTVTPADGQTVVLTAGGKSFTVQSGGSATGSGNVTITFGSAVISGRPIKVFDSDFDFVRFWVQRRRDLREDDPAVPYKSRSKVTPTLTNADHYGTKS